MSAENKTSHTPTPWRWYKLDGLENELNCYNALESEPEGKTVLSYQVLCKDPNPDTWLIISETDAEFIAHACNNYEALVAGCVRLITNIENGKPLTGAFQQIHAALKAAEEIE